MKPDILALMNLDAMKENFSHSPDSGGRVPAIESIVGELPADIKQFYSQYNGGGRGSGTYYRSSADYDSKKVGGSFVLVYLLQDFPPVVENPTWQQFDSFQLYYSEEFDLPKPPAWFKVIGQLYESDLLGFSTRDFEFGAIYFFGASCLQELPEELREEEDPEEHVYVVAPSFAAFLKNLTF